MKFLLKMFYYKQIGVFVCHRCVSRINSQPIYLFPLNVYTAYTATGNVQNNYFALSKRELITPTKTAGK